MALARRGTIDILVHCVLNPVVWFSFLPFVAKMLDLFEEKHEILINFLEIGKWQINYIRLC